MYFVVQLCKPLYLDSLRLDHLGYHGPSLSLSERALVTALIPMLSTKSLIDFGTRRVLIILYWTAFMKLQPSGRFMLLSKTWYRFRAARPKVMTRLGDIAPLVHRLDSEMDNISIQQVGKESVSVAVLCANNNNAE